MIKVMVLGGCGAMGKAIVKDLSEDPEVGRIVVGDVDLGKTRAFVKELRSDKVSAKKVDVTKHRELVKGLQGIDVVANATWYEFNVDIMKACLKTHSHYVDLGGLYHVTKKQLKLDKAFKKAGITAHWLGTGKIAVKGAVPPEAAIAPDSFIAELAKREIHITQR